MRKLALALAAAASLGLVAPTIAAAAPQSAPVQVARADVVNVKTVRHGHRAGRVVVHKRVVHRHHPHYGARKVIVVKKHRPHRTVVRKKVIIRR
jgi:hypothetical protein